MNRHSRPVLAVGGQGLVGHHRAEVGAADADVDDRADPLAGDAGPRAGADLVGEGVDPVEHLVDVGDDVLAVDLERASARQPQRGVQHGAVLGDVDVLAARTSRRAARSRPTSLGQVEQRRQHVVVEQGLRQVDVQVGRGEREPVDPVRVGVEPGPQVGRRSRRRAPAGAPTPASRSGRRARRASLPGPSPSAPRRSRRARSRTS